MFYDLLFDCLFFVVDYFQYGLSHCIECAFVDDIHIVIYRMPEITETGIGIGTVVDDIYTWNLAEVIYVQMVIGNLGSLFFREEVAEPQTMGGIPYLLHVLARSSLGEPFLVKSGILAAYHVKQDSVTGIVAFHMGHTSPVLGAKAPGVWFMGTFIEVGGTIVLGIKENDVDTDGRCLLLQLAGHFKQYTYTAGTVVYAQNGSLVLLLVTVLVCVWTAVPVAQRRTRLLLSGLYAPMILRDFRMVLSYATRSTFWL